MKLPKAQLSTLIGVFLLVVAVRVYVVYESGMRGADDAYITYRYAENLAAGSGFVYNSGERVLGVTTPLYTILLALFALIHLPLPATSQALGILAAGAIGALLFSYSRRIISDSASIVAPALYAFWPNAINTDVSGMESTLFVLAIMIFFNALLTARYRMAVVISALSTLLRPEGAVIIALLFLFKYTIKQRSFKQDYLSDIVIVSAILAPWIIFATFYFGSPIPNSVVAKLALYGPLEQGGAMSRSVELLNLNSLLGWLALLGALWGVVYSLMRVYWGWLEALFFGAVLCGLAISDTHIFFWYKAPLTLVLVLFLGIGAAGIFAVAGNLLQNRRVLYIIATLVVVTAIPAVGVSFSKMMAYNKEQAHIYESERRSAGEYLAQVADLSVDEPIVIAEDIGYPGYYYRGVLVDRDGLVSPEAIQRNSDGDYAAFLEDCLKKYPAHWLAFNLRSPTAPQIIGSGILESHYQIVSDFASEGSQNYLIYRAIPREQRNN